MSNQYINMGVKVEGGSTISLKGYDTKHGTFTDTCDFNGMIKVMGQKVLAGEEPSELHWYLSTQVKDKNGVEIFEGCLLQHPLGICIVKYFPSNCVSCSGFKVQLKDTVSDEYVDELGVLEHAHDSQLEIIGHIESDKHLII